MTNKTCPICSKFLSLKQINFNLAVYICDDLKCKYPVGYDCIVVERKLEDMNKSIEILNGKEDLNDWLNEVGTNEEGTSVPNTSVTNTNDVNVEESTEWIDNLVEKAVNEVKQNEVPATTSTNTESLETDFDDILKFIYSQ